MSDLGVKGHIPGAIHSHVFQMIWAQLLDVLRRCQ